MLPRIRLILLLLLLSGVDAGLLLELDQGLFEYRSFVLLLLQRYVRRSLQLARSRDSTKCAYAS
jgi:hypothetical protein